MSDEEGKLSRGELSRWAERLMNEFLRRTCTTLDQYTLTWLDGNEGGAVYLPNIAHPLCQLYQIHFSRNLTGNRYEKEISSRRPSLKSLYWMEPAINGIDGSALKGLFEMHLRVWADLCHLRQYRVVLAERGRIVAITDSPFMRSTFISNHLNPD